MAEVLEHILPMKHKMGDLADVKISSPQDGEVPTYVAADKKWENKSPQAGTPATTVVTEKSYGQTEVVGTGTKYAREDHTHGSPPHDDHSLLTNVTPDQHHAKLHEASHISGGTDAFLSTDVLEAIVKRLQESGGPTNLLMGSVADGQFLKRSGTSIIGAAAGGGGVPNAADVWVQLVRA